MIVLSETSEVIVLDYFAPTGVPSGVNFPQRIENVTFADGNFKPAKIESMVKASNDDERSEAARKLAEENPNSGDEQDSLADTPAR